MEDTKVGGRKIYFGERGDLSTAVRRAPDCIFPMLQAYFKEKMLDKRWLLYYYINESNFLGRKRIKIKSEFKDFDNKYISDGIKNDYESWHMKEGFHTSSNVFIESPTGTGKTHFIIHKLFSYALKMNRSIIYVCNRDALKQQTLLTLKQSMPELNMIEYNKICIFISPNSSGRIAIVNYQSVKKLNIQGIYPNDPNDPTRLKNLFYIVFDETHFFLEDSIFNVDTHGIYQYMLKQFEKQVHIFISATMSDFYELFNVSLEALLPKHTQQEISNALRTINCTYYCNTYSKPIYNIILYQSDSFLFNEIKNSENSKWLYFILSRQNGNSMKQCIELMTSKKCIFLTSSDKNRKIWRTLTQENRFDKEILIATSVLDNGISIHDDAVKNIVLPFCNRTEFQQMLGRIRLDADSSSALNVYVKIPSIQSINKRLRDIYKKLSVERTLTKPCSEHYKQRMIKHYLRSEDYNKLFHVQFKNNKIFLQNNALTIYKLYQEADFYEYLKDSCANTQIYLNCLNLWLEKQIISIHNEKIQSGENDFIDFLNSNVDKSISDQEVFYESFLELYKIFCYNKFMQQAPQNKKQYTAALSIRKGTTQRKATINRSLNFLELPYQLYKKKNSWILCKLPQ